MVATETVVVPKKLRIKYSSRTLCTVSLISYDSQTVRSSSNARAAEMSKSTRNPINKVAEHNIHKGTNGGGRLACGPANKKPWPRMVADKCGKCWRSACQCKLHGDSAHATSDTSYERSSEIVDHTWSSKLVSQRKRKPNPDSGENKHPNSQQLITPATDATMCKQWKPPICDAQLSPTKALRAATLKRRFADTILKAQHKTLVEMHGGKADPMKLRLEKRQREEAKIREAEGACLEREREAARIALQKMEKRGDIVQNLEIVKELEKLSGCTLSYSFSHGRKSPLERLGLYIKADYVDDDDLLDDDHEEGEIF